MRQSSYPLQPTLLQYSSKSNLMYTEIPLVPMIGQVVSIITGVPPCLIWSCKFRKPGQVSPVLTLPLLLPNDAINHQDCLPVSIKHLALGRLRNEPLSCSLHQLQTLPLLTRPQNVLLPHPTSYLPSTLFCFISSPKAGLITFCSILHLGSFIEM